MNTFVKLFVIKRINEPCILLFGYGLSGALPERSWSSGKIEKDLNLYRLTCVMNEKETHNFQYKLIQKEIIKINNEFCISTGFIQRPAVIAYPKRDFLLTNTNLLKSLSHVKEFWDLDKDLLFDKLNEVYSGKNARGQRSKIKKVIEKISHETGLCFFKSAAGKLGNIEFYSPSSWMEAFEYKIERMYEKNARKIVAVKVIVKKLIDVERELLVNCVLKNAENCILNQTRRWNVFENLIEFTANEVISEININVWDQINGKLIYTCDEILMRQMVFSTNIANNCIYLLHDKWTEKLEKTFGGNKEKREKLDKIRKISRNNAPMVSKIGDYVDDPWNEAKVIAKKIIEIYDYGEKKGVFCKKIGEGDCEIDSFIHISNYLNSSKIKKVILVDPYFSVISMEKILGRITNANLHLEIITSLSNVDPDKENNVLDESYLSKVRTFLCNNSDVIHQSLRIINITRNNNTAIHDRYLLRLMDNNFVDGYLLSNSLNSAGQKYSFVIAPMDKEVVYDVLEYISELKDIDVQKQKGKKEQVQIEILWDTFEQKYEKEITYSIPNQEWKVEMTKNYSNGEILNLDALFCNDWDDNDDNAKKCVMKLAWYLYSSNVYKLKECINYLKEKEFDLIYFKQICFNIAIELEKEEEAFEKSNVNDRRRENYAFRKALYPEKQNEVKLKPKYLITHGASIFYEFNSFLHYIYEFIYHVDHPELVSVMEIAHSPKAMEILLEKQLFNDEFDIDIYDKMLNSKISWINEWAYYYAVYFVMLKIEKSELINDQFYLFLDNHDTFAIYQYACFIEQVSFKINSLNERDKCDLDYLARLNNQFESYIKKAVQLLNKNIIYDRNFLFKLLYGPNNKINCENFKLIVPKLLKKEYKNIFYEQIISIIKMKWDKDEQFFAYTDYSVTHCVAYASYQYWNNDIDIILDTLKINNKNLFIAMEPGKYDMDFTNWNKSVQKVLWHMLFLKYYRNLLIENNDIGSGSYNKVEQLLIELGAIKTQCKKWHDNAGIVNTVFE